MAFCSRSRRKFSYIQLTGRFENPLTSSRNRRTFCFSFFINNKTSLASFFEIFPLLPSQEREPLNSRFVPLQRTFIPDGKVSNYPRDLSLNGNKFVPRASLPFFFSKGKESEQEFLVDRIFITSNSSFI